MPIQRIENTPKYHPCNPIGIAKNHPCLTMLAVGVVAAAVALYMNTSSGPFQNVSCHDPSFVDAMMKDFYGKDVNWSIEFQEGSFKVLDDSATALGIGKVAPLQEAWNMSLENLKDKCYLLYQTTQGECRLVYDDPLNEIYFRNTVSDLSFFGLPIATTAGELEEICSVNIDELGKYLATLALSEKL